MSIFSNQLSGAFNQLGQTTGDACTLSNLPGVTFYATAREASMDMELDDFGPMEEVTDTCSIHRSLFPANQEPQRDMTLIFTATGERYQVLSHSADAVFYHLMLRREEKRNRT